MHKIQGILFFLSTYKYVITIATYKRLNILKATRRQLFITKTLQVMNLVISPTL